eukprot:TRINITY_DN3227_c0_g1_i1.p2 TRINITY_DN3227_c0_g1~~TRINITY_DN3227_c0_g1_i1.p2  ORF type:complete len:214 (-),score=79.39 TRINITY_DN3227_c0_g1_i1:1119-1760(-)
MIANGVSSSESRSFGVVISSLAQIDWNFTCKYSSNYTKVNESLKISMGLQGDKTKWNTQLFINVVAKLMGVLPSQIKILFSTYSKRSEESILQAADNMKVEFEVSGEDAAAKGSQFLSAVKIDNQLLQEAGVKVTTAGAEVTSPTPAPTPEPFNPDGQPDGKTPTPTPSSEKKGKVLIAVVVFSSIFGAVLLGIFAFVIFFRGRKEMFDVEMM